MTETFFMQKIFGTFPFKLNLGNLKKENPSKLPIIIISSTIITFDF